MKRSIKRAILVAAAVVGLEGAARAVRSRLRARGVGTWRPLVPARALGEAVGRAVAALRDAAPGEPFGDYLEFGVSRGTSLAVVHRVLAEAGLRDVRLIGFDSFEGMPPEAAREGWRPGQYRSTLAATRRYLASAGVDLRRVELVKGWFTDTLNPATRERLSLGRAGLIMIDCDIHSASRLALEFCAPHIGERAVIVLDDWGWRADGGQVGQKEAFEEFLAAHPGLWAAALESYHPKARMFMVTRAAASARG